MREQEKLEQGREEEAGEIIVRMYQNGFTLEQIAICTNRGKNKSHP
jgi:hypothetical protein